MSKELIKFKNTFGDIINIKAQPGLECAKFLEQVVCIEELMYEQEGL